jgi:hypothetical protein
MMPPARELAPADVAIVDPIGAQFSLGGFHRVWGLDGEDIAELSSDAFRPFRRHDSVQRTLSPWLKCGLKYGVLLFAHNNT